MSKQLEMPETNIDLQREKLEVNGLNPALKPQPKTSLVLANQDDDVNNDTPRDTQGKLGAIVSLSAALLAVSFAAIFIRLSEGEISANATVFNRLWIATVVFAVWNGVGAARRQISETEPQVRSNYTLRDLMLLIAVGIVSSASLGFWAWSLTRTNVANSTVLRNLTPLFTTLGGWLLLGRRFDRRFLVGMAVALAGAIAIGLDDLQTAGENLAGDLAALLSAMFYAGNLLIAEHLRTKFPATTILMWRCFIGSLLILPLVLLAGDRIFPYSWQGWLAVIALAVICQAFGQGLLIHSLGRLSSGFVALFLLLEPVITAILAWILFTENLSLFNWLAFSVVLAGIYIAKSSNSADKNSTEKKYN